MKRRWQGIVLGEPVSKANSRRIVRFGSKLRVIKSEKGLAYVEAVAKQVPELPEDRQLRAPIRLTAHIHYASNRPDLDPSLLLDALQGRIYRNDRAVREMHLYHHLDRANPRAEVYLEEIDE